MCQNMKQAHAAISQSDIEEHFNELKKTLDGNHQRINYDESNLTDDPGANKVITKKGIKLVTRIMDSSKSSTSIVAITASGKVLLGYVVYRATHLYDIWCEGGPDEY